MGKSLKNIFNYDYNKVEKDEKKYHEDLYRWKKVAYSKDDMRLLKKLVNGAIKQNHNKHFVGFRQSARNIDYVSQKNQRVTFKMSYSPKIDVHKAYISTYMSQEDKINVTEKPEIFGTEKNEYEANMIGKHYKCILSPENQNVDLKILCSEFIKRIEVMTGFKVYWQGAIHNNTEHRHAHICINGKDKNGREVYFQPEMIQRTMRETLSYIATQMVGERTEQEIIAARENLVNAKRWTALDEKIRNYPSKISVRMIDSEIQNRLSFLTKIGLATKYEKFYQMKSDWQNVLEATGRYNTFLFEYTENNGNLELYSGGEIKGEVLKVINFDKDESWNDAIIVRKDGKNFYVPVANLKHDGIQGKTVLINAEKTDRLKKIKNDQIKIIEKTNKKNEHEI